MEFWIYIIISIVGILIISVIAILIKCLGYKKNVRKARTMSMMSNQSNAEAGRRPRPGMRADASPDMPAPPPYSVSLHHPVIARSRADSNAPSVGAPDVPEQMVQVNTDVTVCEISQESVGALPVEDFFVPPPYCEEPPAYTEVQERFTAQTSDITGSNVDSLHTNL